MIAILVRLPPIILNFDSTDRHNNNNNVDRILRSDSFFEIDAREWTLPAIVLVVSPSGVSAWVILIKANRV
jgi:hypothetical protein